MSPMSPKLKSKARPNRPRPEAGFSNYNSTNNQEISSPTSYLQKAQNGAKEAKAEITQGNQPIIEIA